ncbi:four helix bundle protein [Polycyclovorans algicola]|uniref:four helix bundle protein n=1 Tax=Polycyclovorans algicola TaxID=616992 RepID=UPI0006932033|nr:four helix bundle protein [Polycyclovorans algicola]
MSTPLALPLAVDACRELIVWMVNELYQFPRSQRYTLGTRIETLLLEVLERLLLSTCARPSEQARHLEPANAKLDLLRHLWRVALEVKAVAPKTHSHAAERLLDIAKQVGGWRRARGAP